jgi:hypothetical protein
VQADVLPAPIRTYGHGDHGGHADDRPDLVDLEVLAQDHSNAWRSPAEVEPKVGPRGIPGSVKKRADPPVDLTAEFRGGGVRYSELVGRPILRTAC